MKQQLNTMQKYHAVPIGQYTPERERERERERESDPAQVYSGRCALQRHYQNAAFSFTAWGKLYSRKLIGSARFPEGLNHEDEFFNNHILPACTSVVCIPYKLYSYRRHDAAFTCKPFSEKRLDIFTVNYDAFLFLSEAGFTEVLPYVAKEFWRRFYHYGRRAVKKKCLSLKKEQELLVFCRSLFDAHYPPKHPLIYCLARLFLSRHGRPLFYWLYGKL